MGWLQKILSGQSGLDKHSPISTNLDEANFQQIVIEFSGPQINTSDWPDERIAQCPNCQANLKKVPGAKTKCPECKEYMYVRTDPRTKSRRVVAENEIEPIEREWAKLNGTLEEYEANLIHVANTKKILHAELGREATKAELGIRLAELERPEHFENHHFGMLRNTYMTVGQIQLREKSYSKALTNFLIVALLDGNGCSNNPAFDLETFEIKKEPLGFDSEFADYLPYVAGAIQECIEKGSLDLDLAIQDIDELAEVSRLKCPKGMAAVWKQFVKKAPYPS